MLLNLLVTLLLLFIHFFLLIKKFFSWLVVKIIYRPLRAVARFLFYKIVVRLYGSYFFLVKKFGWQRAKNNPVFLLIKQKFVHVLVVVMTVLLLFINLSAKTKAEDLTAVPTRTILADLIKNEFDALAQEEDAGQLIVETFDQEQTISAIQQSYLDNLSAFRPQAVANMNSQEEENNMKTIQNGASIVKPDIATTKISKRARTEIITYTIKDGDTISTIAQEFDLNVSTILWENNLTVYSIIRPGDTLRVLPSDGINHKIARGETLASIAKNYGIDQAKILEANKIPDGTKLAIGSQIFIPDGKKLYSQAAQSAQAKSNRYTGISALINLFKEEPAETSVFGNKMHWPTAVRRITQYFSWRHTAVDIAGATGIPIYAADAGEVEVVGWGTGYGNQIVIDHGGGKKTRYGHLSKFYVQKSDIVVKGQTIGLMGSTGWSTGPHVHFEVIINGVKYNPLNYIK